MRIRILVAEDVDVLRESLVALLELEDDLDVVAALGDGRQIVPAALRHRPDVALLDIDLPGTDGLTAAAELGERLSTCRVLILTGLTGDDHLARALAAGVSGFLVKDGPVDGLVDAVRRVARGEDVFIRPPHRHRRK
jgi:two-component system response regulator DesR